MNAPVPFALHLELESTGRLVVPVELLRYNVAALGETDLPAHSALVLLRPKANASDQSGLLELPGADGRPYLTFWYTVVRVWEESVEAFLTASPGQAPLAVLTNEAAGNLAGAFGRITKMRSRCGCGAEGHCKLAYSMIDSAVAVFPPGRSRVSSANRTSSGHASCGRKLNALSRNVPPFGNRHDGDGEVAHGLRVRRGEGGRFQDRGCRNALRIKAADDGLDLFLR